VTEQSTASGLDFKAGMSAKSNGTDLMVDEVLAPDFVCHDPNS
jgi:hypothetical protein